MILFIILLLQLSIAFFHHCSIKLPFKAPIKGRFIGGIKMCQHLKKCSPFIIKNLEINTKINYNITNNITNNIINQISGFYGLIGPDIDKNSIKTLYELFTGDGMIQGVFLDKGNITFVKHILRTEKIVYEEKHGRFSKNLLITVFYMLMNKLNLLPNVLGLANTAFLNIENDTFALFERDLPYQIDINFTNKQLRTIKKIDIQGIENFSGHSKYIDNIVHTIDYDFLTKTVSYITFDNKFQEINKVFLRTSYIPIIHDFAVLKKWFLFIDSPFIWSLFSQFPVVLSNKKNTYIHIYNKYTNVITKFECLTSFTLFHYADIIENNNMIHIYGSQYENMKFYSLELQGKYRKIILNLHTGIVFIKKNPELENMNLDFPLKWKEFVLLRSIENQRIKGFVLCKEGDIVKNIHLPQNRFFCGEPSIIEISGSPFLIGFSYDSFENGFLILLELFNGTYIEIPLVNNIQLKIGFHSAFFSDKK
jgi:hypothetical protein